MPKLNTFDPSKHNMLSDNKRYMYLNLLTSHVYQKDTLRGSWHQCFFCDMYWKLYYLWISLYLRSVLCM